MRSACARMMPRNRSRATASSRAGPSSVSMKPIRQASGVFSSCPALATKSARICSASFSAVMSCSVSDRDRAVERRAVDPGEAGAAVTRSTGTRQGKTRRPAPASPRKHRVGGGEHGRVAQRGREVARLGHGADRLDRRRVGAHDPALRVEQDLRVGEAPRTPPRRPQAAPAPRCRAPAARQRQAPAQRARRAGSARRRAAAAGAGFGPRRGSRSRRARSPAIRRPAIAASAVSADGKDPAETHAVARSIRPTPRNRKTTTSALGTGDTAARRAPDSRRSPRPVDRRRSYGDPRQRIASCAASAARLTRSETVAPILTICTGRASPINSGPITVPPPRCAQQLGADIGAVQLGHDEDVGGGRQAAERVEPAHQPGIERDVGAHLAVIFEIDAALRRAGRPPRGCARRRRRRVAKIRIGQQRDAGFKAQLARLRRGLDRDVGELGRGRVLDAPAVSANKTVRWRASRTVRPNISQPGFISMTRVTSSSMSNELRVTPVTIASASPHATMQAAKTLRSWFTCRWQSR